MCCLKNLIVSSAIIVKYIGGSALLIREMFGYARDHQVSFAPPFFFAKLIGLKPNSLIIC
uniref:Uncharacterized protein n=1 Tax=Aegilops tauschii subsp. strangulata TaxID=200361 RepID=A0A453LSX0_AEGTS